MTSMEVDRPDPYMTTAEVAEHLGVSRQTIARWLELGLPSLQPAGKGGRRIFHLADVRAWLAARNL